MSTPWIVAYAALCVLVLALGVAVLGLLRLVVPQLEQAQSLTERVRTRLRRFGLPAGVVVPAFSAETVEAQLFSDRDLRGRTTALLFLSSTCSACSSLFGDLSRGAVPELDAALVVIVDEDDARELIPASDAGATVLVQHRASLATVFESDRIPHLFVLDEDAAVRVTGSASNWRDVAEFVSAAKKGGEKAAIPTAAMATSPK